MPIDQFLSKNNWHEARVDLGPKISLRRYIDALNWVEKNIDLDTVCHLQEVFWFKHKADQIEFLLRWG